VPASTRVAVKLVERKTAPTALPQQSRGTIVCADILGGLNLRPHLAPHDWTATTA